MSTELPNELEKARQVVNLLNSRLTTTLTEMAKLSEAHLMLRADHNLLQEQHAELKKEIVVVEG